VVEEAGHEILLSFYSPGSVVVTGSRRS